MCLLLSGGGVVQDNLTDFDAAIVSTIRRGIGTIAGVAETLDADRKEVAIRVSRLRQLGVVGTTPRTGRLYVQERL